VTADILPDSPVQSWNYGASSASSPGLKPGATTAQSPPSRTPGRGITAQTTDFAASGRENPVARHGPDQRVREGGLRAVVAAVSTACPRLLRRRLPGARGGLRLRLRGRPLRGGRLRVRRLRRRPSRLGAGGGAGAGARLALRLGRQ